MIHYDLLYYLFSEHFFVMGNNRLPCDPHPFLLQAFVEQHSLQDVVSGLYTYFLDPANLSKSVLTNFEPHLFKYNKWNYFFIPESMQIYLNACRLNNSVL